MRIQNRITCLFFSICTYFLNILLFGFNFPKVLALDVSNTISNNGGIKKNDNALIENETLSIKDFKENNDINYLFTNNYKNVFSDGLLSCMFLIEKNNSSYHTCESFQNDNVCKCFFLKDVMKKCVSSGLLKNNEWFFYEEIDSSCNGVNLGNNISTEKKEIKKRSLNFNEVFHKNKNDNDAKFKIFFISKNDLEELKNLDYNDFFSNAKTYTNDLNVNSGLNKNLKNLDNSKSTSNIFSPNNVNTQLSDNDKFEKSPTNLDKTIMGLVTPDALKINNAGGNISKNTNVPKENIDIIADGVTENIVDSISITNNMNKESNNFIPDIDAETSVVTNPNNNKEIINTNLDNVINFDNRNTNISNTLSNIGNVINKDYENVSSKVIFPDTDLSQINNLKNMSQINVSNDINALNISPEATVDINVNNSQGNDYVSVTESGPNINQDVNLISKSSSNIVNNVENPVLSNPEKVINNPETNIVNVPETNVVIKPENDVVNNPEVNVINNSENNVVNNPENDVVNNPENDVVNNPENDVVNNPENDVVNNPENDVVNNPEINVINEHSNDEIQNNESHENDVENNENQNDSTKDSENSSSEHNDSHNNSDDDTTVNVDTDDKKSSYSTTEIVVSSSKKTKSENYEAPSQNEKSQTTISMDDDESYAVSYNSDTSGSMSGKLINFSRFLATFFIIPLIFL